MGKSQQISIISSIIFIAFLVSCVTLSPNTTNETTPIHETALVQTMTAIPTSTLAPTSTVPAAISTTRSTVTPLPNFEPTEIPGLLQSALTVETLSSFNGHDLQRISGWKYGFHRLEWLDTNHLMLYPFAGVTNQADSTVAGTYPAVFNLESKQFWIPYLSKGVVYGRASLAWSEQLGILIIPGPNNEVYLYEPDGNLRNSYPGPLLGISPSATKLLIDGDTWVDLSSGKTVDFAWNQTGWAAEYAAVPQFPPIWSPDETRVYTCCYAYGDARTGNSFVMPFDGVTIDEKKVEGNLLALHGLWVLNDKYILPWGGYWEGPLFSVYIFDPTAKTFRDISLMTGIPPGNPDRNSPYCNQPFAQNGGRYVWVDCRDGGYLIDLATFHSQRYPTEGSPFSRPNPKWSYDGKFAWFDAEDTKSILSTATQEMQPLPKNCSGFEWHPKDNVLRCMSTDRKSILLLDAQTLSILKEASLPTRFFTMSWSPDGKHIALLARDDNSLWKIDYPNLDNLEQLTTAMPELTRPVPEYNLTESLIKNVIWSVDGTAIAFIGAQDIYVVNTEKVP